MQAKQIVAILVLALALAGWPSQSASADMGPKPSLDFTFTQEQPGSQVSIVTGTLFECDQADCSDAKPLPQLGPQGFGCEATTCHALAYGFSDYHRLEITFSDGKTRRSNIFKTTEFNAQYNVTIRENSLLVEPKLTLGTLSPYLLILFCACCLVGMIAVAILVIVLVGRKNKPQ